MRDTKQTASIAVLGTLAVAFAAATLDSTVVPEESGSGGAGVGGGDGDSGLVPPPESSPATGDLIEIPYLAEALTVVAVIAAIAVLVYVIVNWRRVAKIAVVVAVVLGLLYVVLHVLSGFAGSPASPPGFPESGSPLGGGSGSSTERTQPALPELFVLLVLGVALAVTVIALVRRATDGSDVQSADGDVDEADAAAVGLAAGRAADRLDADAAVDNEVYRTWREMTELLDVDHPESNTPEEFAEAAVVAGLGRADVEALTDLFEAVRYGEMEPSDVHERRASELFRRIEARYAEDEP